MLLKSLISAAAMLSLTACGGPTHTQSVMKAGERGSGPLGMVKSDSIKVDTAEAFKGADSVVIGSFIVGFATYKTDSAKAGGGLMGSGFGGKSTAKSSLTGIDDATMQKITDAAYKDFVASLKASGYKVVDRTDLLANSEFANTKSYPNPYEDSSGGFFGPKSVTKYFSPTSFKHIKAFMGDIPGVTGGFAFDNPSAVAPKYATTTGNKVLHVVYMLDFANADSYGGWHRSTSSVSVGQGLTVVPEVSKIGLIGGEGGTFSTAVGRIALGQPITSDKEFASVNDSTTDVDRGVQIATNVIGALGGIGTNSSREYEFKARPKDYSAAAIDAFKQANDALVGKMAELK